MKNKLMEMGERVLLRKRAVRETGKGFSEEHLPDRAQPESEFYQFHGGSVMGVVSLQFLTA
jgi:hypothetical protein